MKGYVSWAIQLLLQGVATTGAGRPELGLWDLFILCSLYFFPYLHCFPSCSVFLSYLILDMCKSWVLKLVHEFCISYCHAE